MTKKPIRIGHSPLSNNIYAFRAYREPQPGMMEVTGAKDDVTADFNRIMDSILHDWIAKGYLEVTETGKDFLNKHFEKGTPDD